MTRYPVRLDWDDYNTITIQETGIFEPQETPVYEAPEYVDHHTGFTATRLQGSATLTRESVESLNELLKELRVPRRPPRPFSNHRSTWLLDRMRELASSHDLHQDRAHSLEYHQIEAELTYRYQKSADEFTRFLAWYRNMRSDECE